MKRKIHKLLLSFLSHISPNSYCNYIFSRHRMASFNDLEKLRLKAEPFLLPFILNKNDILFDIGSHIGEFIYMGKKVVPPSNIYAFEPNPNQYARLKRVFKNSNIYQIALSSTNGIAEFKVPKISGKIETTRGTLKTDFLEENENSSQKFEVVTKTLDSFVVEHNIENVRLIKADVEGFELEVLKGAVETINTFKPILILELEKRHYKEPLSKVVQNVQSLGYFCFYFDVKSMSIKQVEEDVEEIQLLKYHKVNPIRYVNNFIFIHASDNPSDKIKSVNIAISKEI